jgi:protein-tyrosine phosphatase
MAYRLCFVCMGNICRSPTASVVMRSMLADAGLDEAVEVSSAGTGGWHVGEPADTRAAAALARRGYDAHGHKAQQFSARWFDELDLVLAVDSATAGELKRLAGTQHRDRVRLLREFDPLCRAASGADLDVPDPYYGGPQGFDDVLDMVERACSGLLDELRGGGFG